MTPLLDGSRTMDEIVDAVKDLTSPKRAYYALFMLAQKGYIGKRDNWQPLDQRAYWDGLNADPGFFERRIKKLTIRVVPLGGMTEDAASLSAALADLNLLVATEPLADLTVT